MNACLRALQRVKSRREDSAFRVLQEVRESLAIAVECCDQCEGDVRRSFESLAARERALYHELASKPVKSAQIDIFREKVSAIHQEHSQLEDRLREATQRCRELEEDLSEATRVYQTAHRSREKSDVLLAESLQLFRSLQERREEDEVEDVFRRGRIGYP